MPSNAVTVSVSQVTRRLALTVKADKPLNDVSVRGEISNLIYHKSGHVYFTLKDEAASIKAVMFKSSAEKLRFTLENGMSVVVRCAVQVYEKDGACQLYVNSAEPDGIGDIYVAYEQTKAKLSAEGLFEQKRAFPTFPRKICVITAETGAAVRDIINIIGRRYPLTRLLLIPTLVQGENAPAALVRSIKLANETDADMIIIGRGGGSLEDLYAFNSEAVARALFASRLPTISAVGHETDFTICDFVADTRAPTPSAAAELAVPEIGAVRDTLTAFLESMRTDVLTRLERRESDCNRLFSEIRRKAPFERIKSREEWLNAIENALKSKITSIINTKQSELLRTADAIELKSPLNVMKRGFAAVYKDNAAVNSAKKLSVGDEVSVRFADGAVRARVIAADDGGSERNYNGV